MAQPMPRLNDLFLELEDVRLLTSYCMVLKFIVVYPGCNMETFDVKKCCRDGDGAVYLKDDESIEQIAQFSHKDNEVWGFYFTLLMRSLNHLQIFNLRRLGNF